MKSQFVSHLARELDAFLAFKRAAGRRYTRATYRLRSFDRFLSQAFVAGQNFELDRSIASWLSRTGTRKHSAIRADLSIIRQFCLFLRQRDPSVFVPDHELLPASRCPRFLPHIFTPVHIRYLAEQTQTIRSPAFRALTFKTLLLVLYCTGLRLGEAVSLRLRDVDLEENAFFIDKSKRRSRWVPFCDDVATHLHQYLEERSVVASKSLNAPFFTQPNGRGYSAQTASTVIRTLLRRLGWKPRNGRVGPRPYDLRHSFAVNRLLSWYQEGVDIQAKLPLLSVYMGHDNILGTQVYLSATPQLLELASRRFATRFEQKRHGNA